MSKLTDDRRKAAFAACPETGCDWGSFLRGWNAALDSVVVELPLAWEHLNPQSYEQEVSEALRAAGVKVKE